MQNKNLKTLDDVLKTSWEDIVDFHTRYINPSTVKNLKLIGFSKDFVKAEGNYLWDSDGEKYLDLICGFGAVNTGHNHPYIFEAINKVKDYPNLFQLSLRRLAGALANNLAQITPGKLEKSFFCNSGAEAIEGAIKIARISTGKKEIITAKNSFHGKTMGALTATGQDKYQKYFQPLVPNFNYFPYGDLQALKKILSKKNAAAVILEPVQGEGGVIVPPQGFLPGVQELCRKHKTLLIMDEVQTGIGRTGKMFACEHEAIEPDILCLAKSLGGGVFPIGAYIATNEVWEKAYGSVGKDSLHTSTFGGNTYACAAGLATIELLYREKLIENSAEVGEYLLNELLKIKPKHKMIEAIRGKGLILAVEFKKPNAIINTLTFNAFEELTSAVIIKELVDTHKILATLTLNNPNLIRIEPPLAFTKEEADRVVQALDQAFEKHKNHYNVAKTFYATASAK